MIAEKAGKSYILKKKEAKRGLYQQKETNKAEPEQKIKKRANNDHYNKQQKALWLGLFCALPSGAALIAKPQDSWQKPLLTRSSP